MISVTKQSGHTTYNTVEFILDTVDDVENLPVDGIAVGSTAFVISESTVYMFNNAGDWKEI